jgi:hypothetical protein
MLRVLQQRACYVLSQLWRGRNWRGGLLEIVIFSKRAYLAATFPHSDPRVVEGLCTVVRPSMLTAVRTVGRLLCVAGTLN